MKISKVSSLADIKVRNLAHVCAEPKILTFEIV